MSATSQVSAPSQTSSPPSTCGPSARAKHSRANQTFERTAHTKPSGLAFAEHLAALGTKGLGRSGRADQPTNAELAAPDALEADRLERLSDATTQPEAQHAVHEAFVFQSFAEQVQNPSTFIPAHASPHASTTLDASAALEPNFGAMFEQFVTSVRVGKTAEQACVSLALDVGDGAKIEVMIEDTAVGPSIEVQSDNPAHALAFEKALRRHKR